jgi:hypothetical protein
MSDPQQRASDPVLITDAERSYEEALRIRKNRYKIMMGMRIPLMILAALFYSIPWLAVGLLILSIPLPWIAVLIANDRLPKKAAKVSRYRPERTALTQVPDAQIIEAAAALDARSARTDGPRQEQQDNADHDPPRTGTDG